MVEDSIITFLLSQGVLGVVVIGLYLYVKGQIARERERSDRLEKDNKDLYTEILSNITPALKDTTATMEKMLTVLSKIQYDKDVDERARVLRRDQDDKTR